MMVRIVMSQTDMAQDEVMSALERTQYNVKQVIREYMRSGPLSAAASAAAASAAVSTNQLRFSEIRHFMDKSAETFRRNQEMTRIYQQVMEKKNQQAATAAAEAATAQQQQQQHQQQRSKL
jgi:NACalpha-BTF3-like transcription factor